MEGIGGWAKIWVRTRIGFGSPSASLRGQLTQQGWEDGPRLWSICRWKDPNTVGAYRIRPQHTNLNYDLLLIKEIHRFSNSWSNNFYKPIPSHGASTFYPFFCQGNEPEAKGLPAEDLMFVVNPQRG